VLVTSSLKWAEREKSWNIRVRRGAWGPEKTTHLRKKEKNGTKGAKGLEGEKKDKMQVGHEKERAKHSRRNLKGRMNCT